MSNGTYAGSYGAPLKLVHAQALFTATATIESAGSYGAYNLGGLAVSLANEGLIEATAGIAIDLAGGGSVVNGASGHTAALVYGLTGVELGEAGSVDNVGTIEGIQYGVDLHGGGDVTNAAGGTIVATGTYSEAVVLGESGTVVNGGYLSVQFESAADADSGGIGIDLKSGGSVDNTGRISLVHGYKIYSAMIGITLENGGTVTNTGVITAGYYGLGGTEEPHHPGLHAQAADQAHRGGGHVSPFAIRIVADQYTGLGVGLNGGTLVNSGSGYINGRNIGAKMTGDASLDNEAILIGHQAGLQMYGGVARNDGLIKSNGSYAAGVEEVGGSLINYGTIEGGLQYKDYGVYLLANNQTLSMTNNAGATIAGVTGIEVYGGFSATIVNRGTIESTGAGYAIYFAPHAGGTVIAYGGAVFSGAIAGGGEAFLYLDSGSSEGTIDGFNNIVSVNFGANADWQFQGDNVVAGGLQVAGGTVDVIGTIDDGGQGTVAVDFASGVDLLDLNVGALLNGMAVGDGAGSTLKFGGAGGAGVLTGLGSGTVSGGSIYVVASGFDTYLIGAGGYFTVTGGNTLQAGTVLDDRGTVNLYGWVGGAGAVVVDGTLTTTGASTLAASLTDTGTIAAYGGTLILYGPTDTIAGTVAGTGTVSITGGSATLASGAVLTVQNLVETGGTTKIVVASSLAYAGALTQTSGTLTLNAARLTLSGTDSLAGTVGGTGTLALAGGSTTLNTHAAITAAGWTISGTATALTLAESLSYAGKFSAGGGATVTLGSGDNLTLTQTAGFSGATVGGSGKLFTEGTTTVAGLTIGGSAFWEVTAGTTQAHGTVTIGDASGLKAELYINQTGIYAIADNSGIARGSATTSLIDNAHVFEKTGGTGTSTIAVSFQDTGTVTVMSGTLAFSGPSSNFFGAIGGAGIFALTGGGSQIGAGASIAAAGWTITGAGTRVTLAESLTYAGQFTIGGGAAITLGSGDVLTLKQAAGLAGATIAGSGKLYTEGTTTVAGLTIGGSAFWEVTAGTTQAHGTVTIGDASGLKAELYINQTGVYAITDNSGIARGSATTSLIDNTHVFEKTGGTGTSTIAVSFQDTGTVTVASGTLAFSGPASNFFGAVGGAGSLALTGGNSLIGAGASIATAGWSIAGSATKVTLAESLSYAGQFSLTKATLALGANTLTFGGSSSLAGLVTGTGTLALAGGSLTVGVGAGITAAVWTVSGGSTKVSINTALSYAGNFSAGGGATISVVSGDSLVLTGPAHFTGATLTGYGSAALEGSTTVSVLTIGRTEQVTNSGTLTLASGTLTIGDTSNYAAALANSGTIDITDNSGIARGAAAGSTLSNSHLLEKTGGTGTSLIVPSVANTGTIAVTSGTLDLAGSVTGTGSATIGAGGTLEFAGTVASTQQVGFAASTGELILNDPSGPGLGFAGAISGFGGSDRILLSSFAYNSTTSLAWDQVTANAGTLTITDGGKVAQLTLDGSYTQSSFSQQDAGGATVILDPPAAAVVMAARADATRSAGAAGHPLAGGTVLPAAADLPPPAIAAAASIRTVAPARHLAATDTTGSAALWPHDGARGAAVIHAHWESARPILPDLAGFRADL